MSIRDSSIFARLSKDLGFHKDSLFRIITTAPLRYKKYKIPKRNGGAREVAQPAREVKKIQYWLIAELENSLPISKHAMAYRNELSISDNAQVHAHSNFLLKMDFSNFFPSITQTDLAEHLQNYCHYLSADDLKVISFSTLWAPDRKPPLRLCIGAPSSPLLSNSILFDFDNIISTELDPDISYTRYADDLFFSTLEPNKLSHVQTLVYETATRISYPRLSVNEKKTVDVSRSSHRSVTGIVLKPNGGISVGRDRKRLARTMHHRYIKGELDDEQQEKLMGLLAFIDSVEPGFSDNLRRPRHSRPSK